MSSVAQQQQQQVPAASAGRHQLDTDSARAPAGKQLSVVLPGQASPDQHHQKSLVTPTIVTTAGEPAPGSPGHLFGPLAVQLSGQEVGLFTGLPSCTPTSADGLAAVAANLTHINPFFWGVSPGTHQAPAAAQPDGERAEQQRQQQQPASEGGPAADGKRRQLSKLQLDQLQHSAMILSPLSFLLSPEQEAWLRLGQQQQPPPPPETGPVEQQGQQHRLTAQDLTNHQVPAAYVQARAAQPNPSYSPQISANGSTSQPTRCNNTLTLQPQRPEMAQQLAIGCQAGPPLAHHQSHFCQQPSVLVMGGDGPAGGDFCHQPQAAGLSAPANLNPAGQPPPPPPMIATLHYDGLHYDPHLQQLYLAQQQQHQDMYHHQVYPQMAAMVTPTPTAAATYQPQTHAPGPGAPTVAPQPLIEAVKLKPREDPVIVMEASSSPQNQFNITSTSNSSARSSVSRDTTVNVETLVLNGSPNIKASHQRATKTAAKAPASEPTDPATEVVAKKKSKGGRKKMQVTHEELVARKNRSKERNRVAAKRCRQKRKQFLDELRDRIDNLSDSNKRVLRENTMLKSELELLRKHHKSCRIISQ